MEWNIYLIDSNYEAYAIESNVDFTELNEYIS